MAERDAKWTRFMTDPEWISRKAETEREGILVARAENLFLAPTDYGAPRFERLKSPAQSGLLNGHSNGEAEAGE